MLARAQVAQIGKAKEVAQIARKATTDRQTSIEAKDVEAARLRRLARERRQHELAEQEIAAAQVLTNARYRQEEERGEDRMVAIAQERQQALERERRLNQRDLETHNEAVQLHHHRRENPTLDLQPALEPLTVQPQHGRQPFAQIQPQAPPTLQAPPPPPPQQPPAQRYWGRGSSNDHLYDMPFPFTNHQQELPIWPVVSFPTHDPVTGWRPSLAVASIRRICHCTTRGSVTP